MENGVYLVSDWGLILAFVWGMLIAIFMRASKWGRFMAANMMWFIVATGAGVNLGIVYVFYTHDGLVQWWDVVWVFFASSIVIAAWSLHDMSQRIGEVFGGLRR